MHHRVETKEPHDQDRFGGIKTRFDVLQKELLAIYEAWGKLGDRSLDRHHRLRYKELSDRESKVLVELRQLLRSADEMLGRTLERSR